MKYLPTIFFFGNGPLHKRSRESVLSSGECTREPLVIYAGVNQSSAWGLKLPRFLGGKSNHVAMEAPDLKPFIVIQVFR